jgi:hypothetical protein
MSEHATRKPAPQWTVWLPGWLVALGAIAATAHGLFEVVRASGVPAGLAWLYPVITDGLALVAYAAAEQLTSRRARRYAWFVVVVAAGLSGLAQAAYLAGGVDTAIEHLATTPSGEENVPAPASPMLRFGVGAWPAIAAAVVAHLLFLLAAERGKKSSDPAEPASAAAASRSVVRAEAGRVDGKTVQRPTVQAPTARSVQSPSVQPTAVQRGGVQSGPVQPSGVQDREQVPSVQRTGVQRPVQQHPVPRGGSGSRALPAPATAEAEKAARRWFDEHGRWPSVRELKAATGISQGTCGAALKALREQPAHLHIVDDEPKTRNRA